MLGPAFVAAVVAFAIQQRGYRRFELAIVGFLGIVSLGFLYDLSQVDVDTGAFLGGFVPGFEGTDSILLAVGILGATVMPHVVYLHSALTQDRIEAEDDAERRTLLRFQRVDLAIGLDATDTLVASQVVLSFGIPFALVPMIILTRRRDVMGALVNRRGTTVVASIVAALIIGLNLFLLQQTFFG